MTTKSLLTNKAFLNVISDSFSAFVESGTSRSTAKLKPLHGAIAQDIANRLGRDYSVVAQGYEEDKEGEIQGRYFKKKVDITIKKGKEEIAGVAVKFVMQNYSQNSNNYFENMLGETANLRSNKRLYFQIFIILDTLPYYDRSRKITKWETITLHQLAKYKMLSKDNTDVFFHTPNKTMFCVVHIPSNTKLKTLDEYMRYYGGKKVVVKPTLITGMGNGTVIVNDYEKFIDKVYHAIMAK